MIFAVFLESDSNTLNSSYKLSSFLHEYLMTLAILPGLSLSLFVLSDGSQTNGARKYVAQGKVIQHRKSGMLSV